MDQLNELIEALREKGHTIPEEVKDLRGLIIAVKAQPQGGAKAAAPGGSDEIDRVWNMSATRVPHQPQRSTGADAVIREQERLARRFSAGAQ